MTTGEQQTLAWVNGLRAAAGASPLEKLPEDDILPLKEVFSRRSRTCPIARALKDTYPSVSVCDLWIDNVGLSPSIIYPPKFVMAFIVEADSEFWKRTNKLWDLQAQVNELGYELVKK
jgi:hypothetical protein